MFPIGVSILNLIVSGYLKQSLRESHSESFPKFLQIED